MTASQVQTPTPIRTMDGGDLQAAVDRSAVGGAFAAVRRVGALTGTLPAEVAAAVAAVDVAARARPTRTPTADVAHRAAVTALVDAAWTDGTVDPARAARTVVAARKADADAVLAADLAAAAHAEIAARAVAVIRGHAEQLLELIRPATLEAYAALDAAVAARADISQHTQAIGAFYSVRAAFIRARILPPLAVDVNGLFAHAADIWRHEYGTRLGNTHGLFVPSALPEAFSVDWWTTLSRRGAAWWAPLPSEEDAACASYYQAAISRTVVDAYGSTPTPTRSPAGSLA